MLGLVDPGLDQTSRGDVPMLRTEVVGGPQARGERLVVVPHFGQHVRRRDVVRIVVQHPLDPRHVAIERSVIPPILRVRSARGSVMAKSWSAWVSNIR